jgi:hypothetical protein
MACVTDTTASYVLEADANTHSAREPIRPDEFGSGVSGLTAVYGEVRSLCDPDQNDGCQAPDESIVGRTFDILGQTAYAMMVIDRSSVFPHGYAATDDQGGIRIEWWHNRTDCVMLVVGQNKSYVFVKFGAGQIGKMEQVAPRRLAALLLALSRLRSQQG